MRRNKGQTSLKKRHSAGNSMHDNDRLPPELRVWLSRAILPWRPNSVKAVYGKALQRTQTHDAALEELDRIESHLVRKDVRKIWGASHPNA